MRVITKGWPPERRQKQAQRCKVLRPSQFSTGPKTKIGKKKSSCNSFKHGGRNALMRYLLKLLTAQKRFVARVLARIKCVFENFKERASARRDQCRGRYRDFKAALDFKAQENQTPFYAPLACHSC